MKTSSARILLRCGQTACFWMMRLRATSQSLPMSVPLTYFAGIGPAFYTRFVRLEIYMENKTDDMKTFKEEK